LLRKAQTEAGGHIGENESSRDDCGKVSVNPTALVWRQEEIKGAESVAWKSRLARVESEAKLRRLNVKCWVEAGEGEDAVQPICGHRPELSQ
jgi:hypothetical protein